MPPGHLEGWLFKQGEKGLVKGWKNRWFSLADDFELHYYANNTTMESLGFIDIRIITSVIADPSRKKDAKGFVFYINTPARVYNLAANTEKELAYWVDGLNSKLPERRNSVSLSKLQGDTPDRALMAQLLSEKDTKFEVLSKEASKQRLKLESCERELVAKEERLTSLMDQVQNLTSLVAREKESTESGAEEATKLQVKVQQLTEQLDWERQTTSGANDKVSSLETTIATLRAQNDAQAQAYARVDADLARTREDAERLRGEQEGKLREADSRVSSLKGEIELLNQNVLHLKSQLKEREDNRDRDSDSHNKRLSLLDKTNSDLLVSNGNLEQLLKERGDEVRLWQEKYNANEQKLKELTQTLMETAEKLKEKENEIHQQNHNQAQDQHHNEEEKQKYENDMQAKQEALDEWEVKWEEMQHFLKEKADQVEEWKQRWTQIEENLGERVREDEELRGKLESLQREHEERTSEVENWKGKWWEVKEKLDEAQKIAREREEEAEKWRIRWEELNADLKGQEESIESMGKEWDGIHKTLQEELDELKETAKTREEVLNAVSLFLEQLSAPVTENGTSENEPHASKLSLPSKALRGKYEHLSQKGIAIFHMLEDKRRIENENKYLKTELDAKNNDNEAEHKKIQNEVIEELQNEVRELRKSESDLRQSLRQAEENLRQSEETIHQSEETLRSTIGPMKEEIELLKYELEAERVANADNNATNNDNNKNSNDNDATNEALQALAEVHADAHDMHTKIDQMLQQAQANEASAQVLKDAEEAVSLLHAKLGQLSKEMDKMRAEKSSAVDSQELEALNKKLQTQEQEYRHKEMELEEKLRGLEAQLESVTKERETMARELEDSKGDGAQNLRKRVEELEDELRAKEDDFRILRQVRQGEFLLKEEELRKREAELAELRNSIAGPNVTVTGTSPPSSSSEPTARMLQHHNSMSSIEFLQRSPRSKRESVSNVLQLKVDDLVQELKAKKDELRKKDEVSQAHELEAQELRLKLTEFEMEAKQKELELQAAKEIAMYEMEMRVAELEQTVRARELALQMKEVELQAMSSQFTVVQNTHEMMRHEVDETVTRAQDESNQREEEVEDLYHRLEMAKEVVIQAHNDIAQKEETAQQLYKRTEELEGWLKAKEAEVEQIQKENQNNIQALQTEITDLTTQIQDKSTHIETLTKKVTTLQESLNKSSRAVVEQKTAADVVDLQRKISRLNAEHAFKDDLISNLKRSLEKKGFFGSSNTADIGLVRQLENEKEARLAQQQHITFLCQELDRMEMEAKTKDAKLQTLIERTSSLTASPTPLSPSEADAELRKCKQELINLRENYFLSVGRSVKLQGSMVGWYANVPLSELYEVALAEEVAIADWPSWITKKFQEANILKPIEDEN